MPAGHGEQPVIVLSSVVYLSAGNVSRESVTANQTLRYPARSFVSEDDDYRFCDPCS